MLVAFHVERFFGNPMSVRVSEEAATHNYGHDQIEVRAKKQKNNRHTDESD